MSSTIMQVQKLLATANELAQKAKTDPALAEKLLKDPAATISQAAGAPIPNGVGVKASRAADGSIQFSTNANQNDQTKKLLGYGMLLQTAGVLVAAAKKDPKIAEQLAKDPAKAVSDAAGYPIPKGILVKSAKSAKGEPDLAVSVDPAFQGELDDMLLENVAGGKGGASQTIQGTAIGGAAANMIVPGSGTLIMTGGMIGAQQQMNRGKF